MRKFLAIAWNDIKIEFESRATLIFFLVLPLVFTTIIGVALGNMYGGTGSTTDNRPVVLVADEDRGPVSENILSLLNQSEVVRPEQIDREEGMQRVQDGSPALLVIPANFSTDLSAGQLTSLQLVVNSSDTTAVSIEQAVNAIREQVESSLEIATQSVTIAGQLRPFSGEDEWAAYFDGSLRLAQTKLADPTVRTMATTSPTVVVSQIPSGFDQSSPGQLVTWVLITLTGGAEVFVNERIGGTLRRLVITPTSRALILLGKIAGRLGMGMVQMILLVGFGALALGVNWGRSPAALALILFGFGLAGTSMGVMLGAFARTRGQASNLAVLFSMLLAALGGAWWPLEVTPPGFQQAVMALPSTWAMRGFTDVIVRGQGVNGVLLEFGVLLAFSLVFFVIGTSRLQYE